VLHGNGGLRPCDTNTPSAESPAAAPASPPPLLGGLHICIIYVSTEGGMGGEPLAAPRAEELQWDIFYPGISFTPIPPSHRADFLL
jgi:hypothetical protein